VAQSYRIAKDSLGEVQVPEEAYYGAQTQRAVQNFPISGQRLPRPFIRAQGLIKASCAKANWETGSLEERLARAIIQAAEEVAEGKWDDQFVVDAYQAGAGTSQNMNANEVIASRAAELLGGRRGDYDKVHPNDHVNMAQSTNDTIHVAINISCAEEVHHRLLPAVHHLADAFQEKAEAYQDVIKAGRTHLQDAVPIRFSQVFGGYAQTLRQAASGIKECLPFLYEIGLGGNAVGTGINAHPEYGRFAVAEIARRTGLPFKEPVNRFSFMQNTGAALRLSHALNELAVHLIKISSDLRLLSSGPRTGLAELILPAVQPGSSIMPGKVNPVMAENLYMICAQVIGNDAAVTAAASESQLEINVMMPVIAYNLLHAINILTNGINAFNERCVQGMEVNRKQCAYWLERSTALATALNPYIGYERAAKLAQKAFREGKTVREVVLEENILSEEETSRILDPKNLV
jgi:fumarate hydratase class II